MTEKLGTKGVIYARYSCEKQREESITSQIRECREFAKRFGIIIVDEYHDEAISGTTDKRPAFQKMISDSQTRTFDVVIVWKGDRFARCREDAARYKKILKKNGVRVLSATEANIEGPESILLDGMNEAYAEYYSAELAVKVRRGMTQNVIEGKWNGGSRPFGYRKSADGKIELEPTEAPIVKELFQIYSTAGYSLAQIAKIFYDKGYRRANGARISSGTLYHIVADQKYAGVYTYAGKEYKDYYPPIVTMDLVKECTKIRAKNKKSRSKFKTVKGYLLSGKAFCGECGGRLVGVCGRSHTGEQHHYYVCKKAYREKACTNHTVDCDALEQATAQAILDTLYEGKNIDQITEMILQYAKQSNPDTSAMESEYKATLKKVERMTELYVNGITVGGVVEKLKALQDQADQQLMELERAKRKGQLINPEAIKNYLTHIMKIGKVGQSTERLLFATYLDHICLYDDFTIDVYIKLPDKLEHNEGMSEVRMVKHPVHH